MKEYLYFNKGQRRGTILLVLIVLAIILFKWVL